MLKLFSSLFLFVGLALAQTGTLVDLGNQGQNADFFKFPYTRVISGVTTLPLTCNVGMSVVLVNNLLAPTTGTYYNCTTPNAWTLAGGGGGGGSTDALSILGIPVVGVATNNYALVYNSGVNQIQFQQQLGTTYTAGTGLGLASTVFSVDTTYLDANYFNLGVANTVTTVATPGVAPSAGHLKLYAKTGTTQLCTLDSTATENCFATGVSLPLANTSVTPIALDSTANGGIKNILAIAHGGSGQSTKVDGFDALSPLTTLGDLLYFDGTHNVRLAGNTTTTPKVYTSTGSGGLATAPALSTYVSSVNGSTGAVTVATGNFQTVQIGGVAQTNRPKINYAVTGGLTITGSDNGVDTLTLNFNNSGVTPPFSSGSTAPTGTCASGNVGAGYQQTGVTTNNIGPRTWICSNLAGGFHWVLISNHTVNAASFGLVADGITNDAPAIQAAIDFAKTTFNYGGNFYTSDVYIPCGRYGIGTLLHLPRSGNFSYGAGGGAGPNGVVNLIGETSGCVVFTGLSGFPSTVAGAEIDFPGTNLHSAATVAMSGGGCSTFGTFAAQISQGYVTSISMSVAPTGCASMPTCTITPTGGTGALCHATGHGMIEWDTPTITSGQAVNGRVIGQVIKNITFQEAPVDGTHAIAFFQAGVNTTTVGVEGTPIQAERFGGANFENLIFYGSNQYNPSDFFFSGSCSACSWSNVSSSPTLGTGKYETVAVRTNFWNPGTFEGEGSGCNFGCIVDSVSSSTENGGFGSAFQGRVNQSKVTNIFCDATGGAKNNSYCIAFIASANNTISQIGTAGGGDTAQILYLNSAQNTTDQIATGPPTAANNSCPSGICTGLGPGVLLINADANSFTHHPMPFSDPTFQSRSQFGLTTDSASHNNKFLDWQEVGGSANLSVSDQASNYVQFCDPNTNACGSGGTYSSVGYTVGVSLNGLGTIPVCAANSRGALWPLRGTPDVVQECNGSAFVTISGGASTNTVVTVTFTATPTFNYASGNIQRITMTSNITAVAVSNLVAGAILTLDFIQDGTGGRTVTGYTGVFHGQFVVGTTASKHNVQQYYSPDGTNLYATTLGVINQ